MDPSVVYDPDTGNRVLSESEATQQQHQLTVLASVAQLIGLGRDRHTSGDSATQVRAMICKYK